VAAFSWPGAGGVEVDGCRVQPTAATPSAPHATLTHDTHDTHAHTTPGELLGQGGFADVHAAELADPHMPAFTEAVAVKRLRPDVLKSAADLREFLTEANLLRKLQHRCAGVACVCVCVWLLRAFAVLCRVGLVTANARPTPSPSSRAGVRGPAPPVTACL
jgi:hypothetical protein